MGPLWKNPFQHRMFHPWKLQREERAHVIRQPVADLPEDLLVPLVLGEYEDKSQSEIAAILNCTVKTVEMRIYRARKQLRKRFDTVAKDF